MKCFSDRCLNRASNSLRLPRDAKRSSILASAKESSSGCEGGEHSSDAFGRH